MKITVMNVLLVISIGNYSVHFINYEKVSATSHELILSISNLKFHFQSIKVNRENPRAVQMNSGLEFEGIGVVNWNDSA